jgi:hypothetical protein
MTEDVIARRVRDAVESFAVPAYPGEAPGRPAACGAKVARPRRRRVFAYAALVAFGLAVLAASAALAVPNVLPDRVVRAFARLGVHLRGPGWISLETREVSLDEARAAADFAVVVPVNVRLVKTLLSSDAVHHRAFVELVLQDDRQRQLDLSEFRADPRRPYVSRPAVRVDADGRVHQLAPSIAWRIGDTQLQVTPYDARSRAFAEQLRRETLVSGRSSR